ncbi:MAG: 50S ribosome-binding GTPase [Lachnospiraceae bacterium]|nr:50S ribosome-binding GTPase [Lachnospiraceae bacterium]
MDALMTDNVAEKIMAAIRDVQKNMTKLNIMVMGKTGAGKSTLINNVFSRNLAQTGIGKPVTQSIRKYEIEDFPLAIYDTPGLELGGENAIDELLKESKEVLAKGAMRGISESIHCIWYCVSTPSHRFEEAEVEFIKKFLDEANEFCVPVIIVLTQSYSKKDAKALMSEIEKENLNVVQIVPVLAQDVDIDEDYIIKAYGLDTLIDIVNNVIPEALRNTLAAVQKANLKMKLRKANAIVATAAAAAAATGAIPIPFTDAAVLVPEQIGMIASITAVFGIPIEKATLTALLSATIGTVGTTVMGKTVVSGLLKMIPGVGSVAGGVISASVAAALTAALGEAYIAIMMMVSKGEMSVSELDTAEGKAKISSIFKSKLGLKRNAKGKPVDEEEE